jgi:Xaa-Pro aminopeptidase
LGRDGFPSPDYAQRLDDLCAGLEHQRLAAAVLSRPEHVFYFTGLHPGLNPAFLVVRPDRQTVVAPASVARPDVVAYTDYDIHTGWSVSENAGAALSGVLRASGLASQRVGIERAHLAACYLDVVQAQASETSDIASILWHQRRIKDVVEITQIEANIAANDRAFAAVQQAIRPGISEIDLWVVVYRAMCEAGGIPIILEADVGAGPRASNPDVKPTNTRLKTGDAVLVDIYACGHGYYADTTRVFTLGSPSVKQREIYSILEDALASGEALLGPGRQASEIDASVRGVIECAGYGACFPHHSGHSYGLFQQERPYLIPAETLALEPGMVLAIEPGIYIPGWGGMRLEGSYVITECGARRLDRFPSGLVTC